MPVSTGEAVSGNKAADVKDIFIGLWPILTIILMVVLLKMPIYAAAGIILVLYIVCNRFQVSQLTGIKKTLPAVATTVVFAVGYYLIWNLL
ncbi:MAG: hypothetical protein IKC46_14485 [Lachnospiraceae bacterium]|nr:hypothetical protein [Lachnospiraceae bacterium]